MIKVILASLIFTVSLVAQDLDPKRYSIDDLELMAKNKEWSRVILYIKDIPKSEQNLQWKSLLERAAIGYVAELQKSGFSEAEKVVQDLGYEFPELRDSYKFESLKNELFLTGYRKCFSKVSDVNECAKSAIALMSEKNNSAELRQRIADLVISKSPRDLKKICELLDSLKEKKGFFEKKCTDKIGPDKK